MSKLQKRNKKQNQSQSSNIDAHSSIAFTLAWPAISSWHTAVAPCMAAICRAVHRSLEQKIITKFQKQNTTENQQQI
jgi:hypothetical protein